MADQVIQEIKEKIDIAEVIGEYLPLKRAGINLKGSCPFHSEKTASFMVSPGRGMWHCFGCGEGGDVLSFVQKYEGLTFPEALKVLADKAGVVLPERRDAVQSSKEDAWREELFQANKLAAEFYHQALLQSRSGEVARNYLTKRGLHSETIKSWQIGFAPDGFHHLEEFLTRHKIKLPVSLAAGLLSKNDRGSYDRFRLRAMFPLHDTYGRVVGFAGRTLAEDVKEAKYVNSPDTPVYHKGSFLFGLYFAKQAIRKNDLAVLVEGNLDCITSHQAGVTNVVATSGTAMTAEQLGLLKRLTTNLVLAFDTDSAGQTATRRAIEMAVGLGFDVRVANLAGAKDPDELISQSKEAWLESITKAPNYLDYSFNTSFAGIGANDLEALRKAATKHLEVVNISSNPIIQAQEARRISEKLNVPLGAIMATFKKTSSVSSTSSKLSSRQPSMARPKSRREMLEERILGIAIVNSEMASILPEHIEVTDFASIADPLSYIHGDKTTFTEEQINQYSLLEFIGGEEFSRLENDLDNPDRIKQAFIRQCKELKVLGYKERMNQLAFEIAEIEKSGNAEALARLKGDYDRVSKEYSQIERDLV